jgi:DNA-binding transcriptional MerR regulator
VTPVRAEAEVGSKLYRSISEVSEMVGVKPHVLRYWETQFSMLRPQKNRAGNRRYRADEIKLLLEIKELLYQRRFTIAGAKRRLLDARHDAPQVEIGFDEAGRKLALHEVRTELRRLLDSLRASESAARR